MREAAKYAFSCVAESVAASAEIFGKVCEATNSWLNSKGEICDDGDDKKLILRDGREASISGSALNPEGGSLKSWGITEPVELGPDSSYFKTSLIVGRSDRRIAVSCTLEVGNPMNCLVPISYEAYCPKIIRDIVDTGFGWAVSGTRVTSKCERFNNTGDGDRLWSLITDSTRALPVVVISNQNGFCLHPQLPPRMARDLTGLSLVVHIDDAVSWELTNKYGQEWSCYNGAIRIFWPFRGGEQNPYSHPLWTAQRLLQYSTSAENAANRIRTQIRKRVFGLSAFTIIDDALLTDVIGLYWKEKLEEGRRKASSEKEWLDELEQANTRLSVENRELNKKVASLKMDLLNAQAMHAWREPSAEDVAPITEDLPTVQDAVKKATRCFGDYLVIGGDVMNGASELNSSKISPNKIYDYLSGLADLAHSKQKGPLGKNEIMWLSERGYQVSSESETKKSSTDSKKKRTWHDGEGRRVFLWHMKPTDARHPDACARIYFDWDKSGRKVVVGWVGRHPE